ncbi:unnamed protein product, partial [Staurois parvus]
MKFSVVCSPDTTDTINAILDPGLWNTEEGPQGEGLSLIHSDSTPSVAVADSTEFPEAVTSDASPEE